MSALKMLLLATAGLAGMAHAAADKPVIGPAPDWVKPVAIPAPPAAPDNRSGGDDAPVRLLLSDQQVKFEVGRETVFSNLAVKIQTPQGLAAGNLSFPWNPETDVFNVHKLVIHRDGKDIDILASGQTFTVVRREPNLESAMLDGVLTANIQPEGLQVGDVLEFAISMTSSDPVLKGHVEQVGAAWNGLPIGRAHFKAQWPSSMPVLIRQVGGVAAKPVKAGNTTTLELSLDNVEPLIPPRLAPPRYRMGRVLELTDFRSWADLGALMAPLYAEAGKVPAAGPLRDELEKIRAASTDPVKRTEAALALVQDRVRYVALLMGAGGYVPAAASETWSRRFGDCKAKTALLLALLHELGVAADPVTVSSQLGDGMDQRLPMVGLFDHVLVRATIDGKVYWLDGTRQGDASLARLRTPEFGWGLPLVAQNAALVRMLPPPLEKPDDELLIEIDARAGLSQPAPFKVTSIMRGDDAIGTRLALANMTGEARDRALRDYWKGQFNFVEVKATGAAFDAATGEERMTMEGIATMEWKNGWYETDRTGVGYDADYARTDGPNKDAPFAADYPSYRRNIEKILLPPGFADTSRIDKADVNETVAGTEFRRKAEIRDGVFTIEKTIRALAPEFAAKDAPAAEKRLHELNDLRVYLQRPANYRMTDTELAASMKETPTTAEAFIARGNQLIERQRYADSILDFDKALALDAKSATALADRAVARIWLNQLDEGAKDLDAAAAIEPQHKIVFHGRGMIAERKSDYKAAVDAYSRAIAIDPRDGFAIFRRAQSSWAVGDLDAALADTALGIAQNPQWLEIRAMRATLLGLQGKKPEVVAEARAIIAANPDRKANYMLAAQVEANAGARTEAMQALEQALALKPEADVYVFRAAIRDRTDLAAREADYDAALKLQPEMATALDGKARLLVERGNFPEAIKTFSQGLEKRPGDVNLLSGRGIAYAKSGDAKRSTEDFAAARAKVAEPGLLNNLCYAKAQAGVALDAALSECDAALVKLPDSPTILDSRAFVLLRLGRIDEAISVYDRVLAKDKTIAPSFLGRAIAWSRKGDKAKADADLAAALKINPAVRDEFAGYGVLLDQAK